MTPDTVLQAPTESPPSTVHHEGDTGNAAAVSTSNMPMASSVLTPLGIHPDVQHLPVNIRSLSLLVMAVLAGLFVLHWAKAVFIPLMLGLIFSYALSPIVNWLESKHVPRALGAGVLLLAIIFTIGTAGYVLRDEAVKMVNSLPTAAQKFRQSIQARHERSDSTLDTVQKAATQIEQAARDNAGPVNNRGALRVVVEPPRFNITDYLWTGTLGLITVVWGMGLVTAK